MDATSDRTGIVYFSEFWVSPYSRKILIEFRDFARDRKTLDWLLDHGVDINLTDTARLDDGFNLYVGGTDSSLHLLNNVAADGDIDMFDHLVDRGADVSLCTALHSASACKDPDLSMAMVRCLLDKHHMDINRNNDVFRNFFHDAPDRGTPLCSAILNHNLPVVLELLKRGASPREPHMRPVSYAVQENGFVAALEPLLSAGVDATSALMSAVFHQNLEAAKICLRFGAHPAEALHEALTLEEDRAKERAEDDDDEVSERDVRAERDSKAVIELLRNSIEGGANDQS
jgi:ankyrin repeat protein